MLIVTSLREIVFLCYVCQVWSGCLYLCDFIIYQQQTFDKAVVLELGAGVGLASIVASMFANRIFATGFYTFIEVFCKDQCLVQYLAKLALHLS